MSPRRPDTSPKVGVFTPGPGTYSADKFSATLRSQPNVKIGSSNRDSIQGSLGKNVPGPNHYNVS